MSGPSFELRVETALEEKERLLDLLPALTTEEQDRAILAIKKETDRLIQVDIERCRLLAALIVALAERTGSPTHRALGLLAEANALAIGLGQYAAAVELYNQAAAVFHDSKQPVEQAKALFAKLYALSNLGRYDEALADGEWARAVLSEHQEWYQLARLNVNLAIVYGRMGEDQRALDLLDQACDGYARLGAEGELNLLRVEMNRAHVLRNLGRFDESIKTSQELYEAHLRLGRELDAAKAHQALALTYFVLGRYNEALALLDQVREVFLRDGRQRHAMLVELFMSDCLLQLRRFPDVLDKCRRVRELFTGLGTGFEVGQTILNEAAAYTGLKDYARARISSEEARALFVKEGNRVAVAETDLQRSMILLEIGQAAEALAVAQLAMQAFEEHNLPLWLARAALAAARAALVLRPSVSPSTYIDRALEIGLANHLAAITYAGYHLRGQLALLQNRPREGLADFERAIQDLEQLSGRLMVEFRASFIEDKARLYEDIVALCLDLEQPEQGLIYTERAKSRALMDMIAYRLDLSITPRSEEDRPLVEELVRLRGERDRLYRRWEGGEGFGVRGETAQLLEEDRETAGMIRSIENRITTLWHTLLIRSADYARDAGLWQVRTEPAQPYLRPDTLLLEYFQAHGELLVFVTSGESVQAVRLPGALAALPGLLQFFWLNLNAVQSGLSQNAAGRDPHPMAAANENVRGLLRKLHTLLFRPLEPLLEGARRLIIVPHGALHYLPFHALQDGHAYLLERFEISYLPGSSLLAYLPRHGLRPNGKILAAGNSFHGKLPFAVEEACGVAEVWGEQALVEEAASLEAIRQQAPAARILHLAAHGEFRPDNPLFSGLALEGGWLTTLEIFNLRIQADLVTLSACQTGRSVIGGGDELFGLMRAFLAAGAASLVSTLWTVEDRSTAQLMQSFYQRLVSGMAIGSALRQAQLQFLSGEYPAVYRHPYFWAPFFLAGSSV